MEKSVKIEEILVYVNNNYTNPALSLHMVADCFHISSSLVSRLFTEQYGESFLDYVNRKRLHQAMEYMANEKGETGILIIARQVGYNSDTTFRRAFKKYTGMLPSEYRSKVV